MMKRPLYWSLILGVAAAFGAAAVTVEDRAGFVPARERLDRLPAAGLERVTLELDGTLPPQGFRIDCDENGKTVTLSGGDPRGLYYAVGALQRQLAEHGAAVPLRAAPEWRGRYAGDYTCYAFDAYMTLADNGISGFAWQWRDNWRDFRSDAPSGNERLGTIGDALDEIDRAAATGLLDFMLQLHLYAVNGPRTGKWFDCSDAGDVDALIERCRLAAQHGVRHIMICADDWTPRENGRYVSPTATERAAFADSVGAAHGTLMKKLYEALHPEFPSLEFSLVPPVYSSIGHDCGAPASRQYLRDFDAAAPREVYLVWTGPQVISDRIEQSDYRAFTEELTSGRKLVFWDNSECFTPPMPQWETRFYPGAAQDHDGIIFLNAHTFGWQWAWPFVLGADDYLWNPDGYDARASWLAANAAAYGSADAAKLQAWRDRWLELTAAQKRDDRDEQRRLLAELEKRTAELNPGGERYTRLESALASVRDRLDVKARELALPILSDPADFPDKAVEFTLVRNDGGSEAPALPATVRAAIVGDAFRLRIDCPQPAIGSLPRPVCAPRDDAVYNNFEAVELFIQPGEHTEYGHFVFDPFGNRFDERSSRGADSWNPDWSVKTDRKGDGWTADVAIPLVEFEPLGTTAPAPGVIWRVNLMRMPPEQEPQVFAPTQGYGFHTPEFFGVWRMTEGD